MNNWKTTLCGALAALSTGLQALPGLPAPVRGVAILVCAVALGALGYHAVDCSTCPGISVRKAAGLGLILLLLGLCGCEVARLSWGVSSPAFGTLHMGLGGGVIGHPGIVTNGVPADAWTSTNWAPVAP